MRRREFITLLSGAAVVWPLAARTQQADRVRCVGVLTNLSKDDAEARARDAAFVERLQQLGWSENRNLQIEERRTGGDAEIARNYAAELVALAPDVILTTGSAGLIPLLQVTHTILIVFTIVPDPVGAGFINSLARPGGNATGFSQFEYGLTSKWLELLKEVVPDSRAGWRSRPQRLRNLPRWRRWRPRFTSNSFRSTSAMAATSNGKLIPSRDLAPTG